MKHLPIILGVAAAALFSVPSVTLAETKPAVEPPQRGPGSPLNWDARLKMMTERLSLSEDQQAKIKAIFEKNGPQIKELIAKGTTHLTEDEKTKIKELMKSQKEEIEAVLTPAQKEKMQGDRAGGPGTSTDGRLKMMTERLGLTEDQQAKVKAILEKNAAQFKELQAKGGQNLTEEGKAKMKEIYLAQMEEINSVLTAEQREKMHHPK